MKGRVEKSLIPLKEELNSIVRNIAENLKIPGFEIEVWIPDKIHSVENAGGINIESYLGFGPINGDFCLAIRSIRRDSASKQFISENVYALESCSDVGIVKGALDQVSALGTSIFKTIEEQITMCIQRDSLLYDLKDPGYRFRE